MILRKFVRPEDTHSSLEVCGRKENCMTNQVIQLYSKTKWMLDGEIKSTLVPIYKNGRDIQIT